VADSSVFVGQTGFNVETREFHWSGTQNQTPTSVLFTWRKAERSPHQEEGCYSGSALGRTQRPLASRIRNKATQLTEAWTLQPALAVEPSPYVTSYSSQSESIMEMSWQSVLFIFETT